MRIALLLLLLASPAVAAPRPSNKAGPFYDPTIGFRDALAPILEAFIKARVETTMRGFLARGDDEGAYRKSETEPSDEGLYLNVAVTEGVKGFSDETKNMGVYTSRFIQIPSGRKDVEDLQIELNYGPHTPREPLRAINACVRRIVTMAGGPQKKHRPTASR